MARELGDFEVEDGEDHPVFEFIFWDKLAQAGDDLACLLRSDLHLAAVQLVGVLHVADLDDLADREAGLDDGVLVRGGLRELAGGLLLLLLLLAAAAFAALGLGAVLGLDHRLEELDDVVAGLVELAGHRVVALERLGHEVPRRLASLLVHRLGRVPDLDPRIVGIHAELGNGVAHALADLEDQVVDLLAGLVERAGHLERRGCVVVARGSPISLKKIETPPAADRLD